MGRILAECVKEDEHSGKEGAGYTQRWLGERLGYSNPKTAETAPNKIMKGEQSLTLKQLEACRPPCIIFCEKSRAVYIFDLTIDDAKKEMIYSSSYSHPSVSMLQYIHRRNTPWGYERSHTKEDDAHGKEQKR